jgi:hypothetical protein
MVQYTGYCSYCTVEPTDERELEKTERDGVPVIKCLHCGIVTPQRPIKEDSALFYLSESEAYYEGEGDDYRGEEEGKETETE